MLKYTILSFIILIILSFYQITELNKIKTSLEKQVLGISSQIKEIEEFENNLK